LQFSVTPGFARLGTDTPDKTDWRLTRSTVFGTGLSSPNYCLRVG